MSSHVWYAAYGSNLSWARFSRYLRGGRPRGASRTYRGCRDTSAPTGSAALQLPGRVIFGSLSQVWGGGMAFYDPDRPGPAHATAYRLTAQQFADVWAQECHRPVGGSVPVAEVVARGAWLGDAGSYRRVLHVGRIGDEPVLTFTFAGGVPRANPPSAAYVQTIRSGLVEQRHGLTAQAADAYLGGLLVTATG